MFPIEGTRHIKYCRTSLSNSREKHALRNEASDEVINPRWRVKVWQTMKASREVLYEEERINLALDLRDTNIKVETV